jgi:hypothetical protein
MASRRSNPKRVDLWRDRIRRQEASGLSTNQFCARECCSISAFYRWKQRLPLLSSPAQPRAIPAASPFLPVTVRLLDQVRNESLPIEADLPNGIQLRIPTTNTHLACRLLRAIVRAKTNYGGSQ